MSIRIASLYRYPVKGLSPERLARTSLAAGHYFPGDRLYAIENGPSGFDPAKPEHQPKIKFLMLMRNESLARLKTRYLDDSSTLVIEKDGQDAVRGDLSTNDGRRTIETFFASYMPDELRGTPKVLTGPAGFRFTDSRRGFVSLINLASVRALQDVVGAPVDPLRFRGNLHLDGLDPWTEFDLVGQILTSPSGLRLKVTKRIERCAATNVDPTTGLRDLTIPKTLMQTYGHFDCGVYAEILSGGDLVEGETFVPEQGTLPLS